MDKTNIEQLAQAYKGSGKSALLARNVARLATTTTESDAWIPADVYAKTVFMGVHAKRVLGSLAAAVKVDVGAGQGDTVQVRVFPKRTAQGPIAENVALTNTATANLTTKSLTIQAYGDLDELTAQSMRETSDDLKARVLEAMADSIAEKLEQVVVDVLFDAASTKTSTLDAAGVVDYQDILKAAAVLKKEKMNPDWLIINPDLEPDLMLDSNLTKVADYGSASEVILPGEIGRIGNIRVLVHPLADAKSASAGAVQAVLFDSSRSFGEAFGPPLEFMEDRDITKNTLKVAAWTHYGAAVVDPKAICHLKNA